MPRQQGWFRIAATGSQNAVSSVNPCNTAFVNTDANQHSFLQLTIGLPVELLLVTAQVYVIIGHTILQNPKDYHSFKLPSHSTIKAFPLHENAVPIWWQWHLTNAVQIINMTNALELVKCQQICVKYYEWVNPRQWELRNWLERYTLWWHLLQKHNHRCILFTICSIFHD